MLQVTSTKNIENYKTDVAGGFDLKEVFHIAISTSMGIAIILICSMVLHVPMLLCPYIAAPFVAVPILRKFGKKNGMSLGEAKRREREYCSAKALPYVSSENASNYMRYMTKESAKKNVDEEFDEMVKKLKLLAVIFLVIVFVIIIGLVIYLNF